MKKTLLCLAALVFAFALAAVSAQAETARGCVATPAMDMSLQEYALTHGAEAALSEIAFEEREPFIPTDLDKAIIGSDDRIKIKNTKAYPYSAIGLMFVHARCGCDWNATCFMVGPSGAMTAAHCVVCSKHGKTADSIEIYFGYQSRKNCLYHYTEGTTYWYGTDFRLEEGGHSYTWESNAWDYAYIKLQEAVGDCTGWFGTHVMSKDEENSAAWYDLAGYRDGELKKDIGRLEAYNENMFRYSIDTLPGTSGSPIYNSDYYAVGVNTSYWTIDNQTYNFGRRITSQLMSDMRQDGIFD